MDNHRKEDQIPNFEKDWKKRFESFATAHDNDAGIAGWSSSGLQTRIRAFLRVWKADKSGTNWLDAGCGAGTYSGHLASTGKKVIAVDYSYPTIYKARGKLGRNFPFVVADVTKLPFAVAEFDGAICFGVMQALQRPKPAIQSLKAVIQPGGEIWIDALNKWCLPNIWIRIRRSIKKQPMHLRYDSPMELKKLVKDMDIQEIRLYWLPILPFRFKKFQWLIETSVFSWMIKYIPFSGLLFSHSFIIKGCLPQR